MPKLPASVTAPVRAAVALQALEQSVSARYLSLPVGTISREINRNSHPMLGYRPYGAHRGSGAAQDQ